MPTTGMFRRHYAPLATLAIIYLLLSGLLRLGLWWAFGRSAEVPLPQLPQLLGVGAVNDTVVLLYLSLPLDLYLWRFPRQAWGTLQYRLWRLGLWLSYFSMLYLAAVEFFFFDEFNARFNLVAVDYLMYPHEVMINIWESYPVPQALILVAVGATLMLRLSSSYQPERLLPAASLRQRTLWLLLHLLAIGLVATTVSTQTLAYSRNRVENELAANGVSSFFQALRTNELDYAQLYRTENSQAMRELLRRDLTARDSGGMWANTELSRQILAQPGWGRLNIVVIVEESFGCEDVDACGAHLGLTPQFDALAKQGLFFNQAYATGTRTVRGLEAINVSIPPIPSESIIKRPGFEQVTTWGEILAAAGYRTSFLYGGFGQFDHMNAFFAAHGYQVQDRSNIQQPRFSNIWGVSDQDLFEHARRWFVQEHATGAPFFALIMTTSNHKPFTFPEGIPNVPAQGGGRAAGVRYADYALGEFLYQAAAEAWYKNTLFIVVADHGARVYGKARIPLFSYHIPILLFAPSYLMPQTSEQLASQVDIAPTVMGRLGLAYQAPFIGRDLLITNPRPATLLFNHNHDVALYRDGRLAVLGLRQVADVYRYDLGQREAGERVLDPELITLATAYYQTAFELFRSGHYR